MKIKQLIEYLQKFDPEDRICIKAWVKDKEGQTEKQIILRDCLPTQKRLYHFKKGE